GKQAKTLTAGESDRVLKAPASACRGGLRRSGELGLAAFLSDGPIRLDHRLKATLSGLTILSCAASLEAQSCARIGARQRRSRTWHVAQASSPAARPFEYSCADRWRPRLCTINPGPAWPRPRSAG